MTPGPVPGDGRLASLTTDELRAAVRAVLRDVLPAAVSDVRATDARRADGTGGAEDAEGVVVLRSDADLAGFVRRVATACEDPVQRAALRDGRRRFRLADPSAAGRSAATAGVVRVERGAVTERTVKRAAAEGARLVLGGGAVLTPLARDRARSLGVHVEREER